MKNLLEAKEVETLISRFGERFYKKDNHYAMDYGTRFNPTRDPETNKINYTKSPGDRFKPFWFVGSPTNYHTYEMHIAKEIDGHPLVNTGNEEFYKTQIEECKKYDEVDLGMIFPPCDLNGDSETKGMASWGGMDEDVYKKPDHLKRIVKQIYDEKLPLAPCFSKSGGLHIYIFTKELVEGDNIVGALKHFKKILKATANEINPKQTKPKWDKAKNRWSPGNGILVPYRSSIQFDYGRNKERPINAEGGNDTEYTFIKPDNGWIKNEDMEVGTLKEFLDYADTVEVDQNYFNNLPLDLPEEKEEKIEEETTEKKINFSELNARPLSEKNPLSKIIQNIKNKKEHSRGGTFDNHVVDFVFGAVESKMSNQHILEHLKKVNKYSDKADDNDFFTDRITNCRGKYDKTDPGPLREKFMDDTIYILNAKAKRYFNKRTGKTYEKEPYDIKFAHLFPKSTPPTSHFKDHPKKQLAEEETYRPDLHKENDPLIKGADELYYLNSYKPSKIKPINPETVGNIEPWIKLTEHIAPIEKEREFLLDWLAHIVQNPWKKIKVIILIYTKLERMGKGSIFDTMTDILGETNAEPTDVKGMLDKGVAFAERQLILVDECKSTGEYAEKRNLKNDLKKIASETRIQQRKLYVDYQIIKTQTCYLVFTNEPDALQMDKEDQRFMVIKNENNRLDEKWYKAYHKWREDKGSSYVFYMLKNRDISKFNPHANAPSTKAKEEMQDETGHPLTLKLREMLEEGRYPLTLNTNIISSTELKEYITKHHKGKHVQYVNDPKQLKRSLIDVGAVELGQILHKEHNWKPSLLIIRNHDEMLKIPKPKLCNEIWKPIESHSSPGEKHEEDATDRFNNMDHSKSNGEFEKRFKKSRATFCWSCKKEISTSQDGTCPECEYAIKCECGECACDKPGSKIKKKGAYA